MEHPIIFKGEMVKAILDGRKTQTRRIVKNMPKEADIITCSTLDLDENGHLWCFFGSSDLPADPGGYETIAEAKYPYGQVGDVLWVRETWTHTGTDVWTVADAMLATDGKVLYRATDAEPCVGCWFPSIHMPKWACRLRLEVTDIRVERVQDISEEDAIAEGLAFADGNHKRGLMWTGRGYHGAGFDKDKAPTYHVPDEQGRCRCNVAGKTPAQCAFRELWDSINSKRGFGWDQNNWVWVIRFKVKDSLTKDNQ